MEKLVVEKGKDTEENSGDRRHLLESEETLESKESSSARSSEKSTDESSGDGEATGETEISDMKNINTDIPKLVERDKKEGKNSEHTNTLRLTKKKVRKSAKSLNIPTVEFCEKFCQ